MASLPNIEDIKALAGETKRETSEFDISGTVTKISGETAWVRFDGSDIETPIEATCAGIRPGDAVSVHVSHGDTHIVGNRTAPAIGEDAAREIFEESAEPITRTVADMAGNYSTIEQSVDGIRSEVGSVAGDVSAMKQGPDGFEWEVASKSDTDDAATKATNFMQYDDGALTIGNRQSGEFVGARAVLDSDSLDFKVGDTTVASYGAGTVELGNDSTTADILLAGKKSKIKGIDNDNRVGFNAYTMSGASEAYPNQQASLQLQVPKASGQRGWAILQYSDTSNASNPYNSGVSASSNGVYLYGKDGVFVSSNWSSPSANANRERVLTISEFTETVTTVVNETVASGGAASGNKAAVKPSSGTWYPLCISGWYAGSRYELLSRARLSGKANNACTINYAVQNTSSASRTCSMDIHILWARVY